MRLSVPASHGEGSPADEAAVSLGARLSSLDAARFVGRGAELARLASVLDGEAPAQIVLLNGPGGFGKSALLREFARRAARRGWTPLAIEGRELRR
jgi:predicted ATP-dependent serine protease